MEKITGKTVFIINIFLNIQEEEWRREGRIYLGNANQIVLNINEWGKLEEADDLKKLSSGFALAVCKS